ncbi:MAG TPA: LLM class flavin-dependent oxidoreductase, partial [Dehalococcoidia bacterium]|nr:LLM class flavin-dependent oxidoreductase [Dehalococcoidia bacterium]
MKFGLFFVLQRPDHLSERRIYEAELGQMVLADDLGYDSIWIAEHHFADFGVCPAPQVLAASVAAQTKRLRVGMGITLLPLHDPVQIAEELAVLDQVSDGRLDVGIGRASSTIEYSGFNIPYEESRGRVDEGLEIMRGLWSRDPFSYQGRFRSIDNVSLVPKPVQQPHPPLYLACNSEETVPIAARHGLPMMTSMLVGPRALVKRHEIYRAVSAEHGHAPVEVEDRVAQTWT